MYDNNHSKPATMTFHNFATSNNSYPTQGNIKDNTFHNSGPVDIHVFQEQNTPFVDTTSGGKRNYDPSDLANLFDSTNDIFTQMDSDEETVKSNATNNTNQNQQEQEKSATTPGKTPITNDNVNIPTYGFATAGTHSMASGTKLGTPFQIPYKKSSNRVTPQIQTKPTSCPLKTNTIDGHLKPAAVQTSTPLGNTTTCPEKVTTENPELLKQTLITGIPFKKTALPTFNTTINTIRKPITLDPELEPLRQLILSQHEVFTPHLIELGNTTITLSKIIEKKKENYESLKDNTRIPRSLRVKIDLSTSPSYTNDEDFIQLRDELRDIVSDFITKGKTVMTAWAGKNIQLLLKDRCHNILLKALQILDCLSSFHTDIIGQPNWPSVPHKHITLFLFKLYFSDIFFEHDAILTFFDLPQEIVIKIGAKILTKKESEGEALDLYNALDIHDINDNNETQYTFLAETLNQFDNILKTTTLSLWFHNKQLAKQESAVNNLKTKLLALETISATKATATAIAKATANIQEKNSQDEYKELRITNLEKNFKKYEQKTNEINNKFKNFQTGKTTQHQKNYKGDHLTESMDSLNTHTHNIRKKVSLLSYFFVRS